MKAIVIEHVKASDLPEAWRTRIAADADARVTIRIEQEAPPAAEAPAPELADDPLFGMWRDRADMADVDAYQRKLRTPRLMPMDH